MAWKPLLTGRQRDSASAAVRDIGIVLRDPPPCRVLENQTEEAARVTNATLSLGRAGIAVACGYLSLVHRDEPSYASVARSLIAGTARVMAGERMGPMLYGGFTGIAWALSTLRAWNVVDVADPAFAAVDGALVRYFDRENGGTRAELISGLAGCLIYALARLPNPDAMRILERGLCALEAGAEVTAGGTTWFVPASQLFSTTLERAPHGCYNLGVGHGNPGVFSVVAEMHRRGIDPPRTRRLLEDSVRWLLAQELDGGRFPSLLGPGVDPKPARVAWCYGSPGIAIALLRAAGALEREDWHRKALQLARVAAETPFDDSGVNDPSFCHGAAGLMHQFNRLHQETGDPLFADAARAWLDHALAYRVEGEGLAGFSARSVPGAGTYPEPGMLFGVAGIAASLAAAASDVPPSWDAMFALSDAGTA